MNLIQRTYIDSHNTIYGYGKALTFLIDNKTGIVTYVELDRKESLKQIDEFMKKYHISKENIVVDYSVLKWLFLPKQSQETCN